MKPKKVVILISRVINERSGHSSRINQMEVIPRKVNQ